MGTGRAATDRGQSSGSIVGARFGRLLVTGDSGMRESSGAIKWICVCDCGEVRYISSGPLRRGDYNSCGCWTKDRMRQTPPAKKHGMSDTPTYKIWRAMKRRCQDPSFKDFVRYGGRGIKVCQTWMSFENFLRDMGERPSGMTLDRIDVNGPYSPANCRWASRLTQGNNTSRNHLLTYGGETHTLAEWSRITLIPYTKLRARINILKWPVAKALEKE